MNEKIKNVLKNYLEFYNKNIKKVHIICSILSIFIFLIFLFTKINEFSVLKEISIPKYSYLNALKENLMLTFVIIFAGITPFIYLPVLGFMAIYNIAVDIAVMYVVNKSILSLIFTCVISFIMIVVYSLMIANGIHFCTVSTKRFRYSQSKGFDFNDFKASIYKLRNNEKKIEEYDKKKKEKYKKMEKLNVKVPYLNYIISFVISNIVLLIASIWIR